MNKELENATELELDANEILQMINDRIELELAPTSEQLVDTKSKVEEKITYEIEKLKIESDYKRAKLKKLSEEGHHEATSANRKIKLPDLPLPSFSGDITQWPSFWDSLGSIGYLK